MTTKKVLRCRALAKKLLAIADKEGDLEVFSYNQNNFIVGTETDLLTVSQHHDTFRNSKYESRDLGGEPDRKRTKKSQRRVAVLHC